MNTSDFAKSIRTKYPGAYDNISDQDLTTKIVSKYPEYQSQISDFGQMPVQSQQPPEKGLFGQTIPKPNIPYSGMENTGEAYPPKAVTDDTPSLLMTLQAGTDIAKGGMALGKTLAQNSPSEIASAIGSKATDFKGFIQNLFTKPVTDEELAAAIKGIQDILVSARQKVGQKLGEMRGTQQGALDRLNQIAEKGLNPELSAQEAAKQYNDYFSKIPSANAPLMEEKGLENAPTLGEMKEKLGVKSSEGNAPYTPHPDFAGEAPIRPLQPGDKLTLKSSEPSMPDLEVIHKGPMMKPPSPEFAKQMGYSQDILDSMSQPAFDLKNDMPAHAGDVSHPIDSTIAKETLEKHGYQIPSGVSSGPASEPDPQAELQYLTKLKNNLRDQIGKKTLDQSGNVVKTISSDDERAFTAGINKINQRIEQIPGGKAIRQQEQKFSQLAGIYDDLQSKLQDPNAAKQFLRKIFANPIGKNKDYIDKLMKLENLAGTDVVSNLKDAFESTKGLTYEQLKHPLASIVKSGMPAVGSAARGIASALQTVTPTAAKLGFAQGLDKPFNTPEMHNLKNRLSNAQ